MPQQFAEKRDAVDVFAFLDELSAAMDISAQTVISVSCSAIPERIDSDWRGHLDHCGNGKTSSQKKLKKFAKHKSRRRSNLLLQRYKMNTSFLKGSKVKLTLKEEKEITCLESAATQKDGSLLVVWKTWAHAQITT